jgi:hypothetical protein
MKLNYVSIFSGKGQIQIMHTWSKSWVVDFRGRNSRKRGEKFTDVISGYQALVRMTV